MEKIGKVTLNLNYYDGEDHYSEGANEDLLLSFVRQYKKSEYENVILSSRLWSAMYHLSPRRENIVRFLPINRSMSVLEIGAGCGAVTGALSEMAGSVTCVDLSKKRSLINAERHKEQDNIEIIVGNFETIEPELAEQYDLITLIGVLEYAESYLKTENAYEELLRRAASHLKPGGQLLIAIENQYGLKYFAGCKEDHTGRYYDGIEGYPGIQGVRTFSKAGLTELLSRASLQSVFYYPYPDYKLPFAVYSDAWLPGPGELNRNLNNYDADRIVAFDEENAFNELLREGMFPFFSNSFLVLAGRNGQEQMEDRPIYAKLSDERNPALRIATVIAQDKEKKRYVIKKPLSAAAADHIRAIPEHFEALSRLFENSPFSLNACSLKEDGSTEFAFLRDCLTMEAFLDSLEEDGHFEEMLSLIDRFRELLYQAADVSFSSSELFTTLFSDSFQGQDKAFSVSDIDLIFSNILFDREKRDQGVWNILDYEWTFACPVPLRFILYRSLFYYFRDRKDSPFSCFLRERDIDLYQRYDISKEEVSRIFPAMEQHFQLQLKQQTVSFELLHESMPVSTVYLSRLMEERENRGNLLNPQVYYSKEEQGVFLPENYINVLGSYDDSGQAVSLSIELAEPVKALRVDPAEYPCFVRLLSATLNVEHGTDQASIKASSNGFPLSDETWFFRHDDPQLIFPMLPEGKKLLRICYMVDEPDPKVLSDLKVFFRKTEEEKRKALEEAEREHSSGNLLSRIGNLIRK